MKHASNRRSGNKVLLFGGVAVMAIAPPTAGAGGDISQAFSEGQTTLDIRYRFENVDQNNSLKNADASTVRSRLGYTTGSFYGLSALLEMENITAVGAQDYNSGANGKTAYSVVTDPVGSQVDQAYLGWKGPADTTVKLGRQVINLDNQRFIGRVDWRQNGQTLDALNVVNEFLPATTITYAYISNVDRITATSAGMNSNILNVNYSGWTAGSLSGYAYLLDYAKTPSQSTQTYGLRFAGKTDVDESKRVIYTVEFANQSDYARNPGRYSLDYMLAELGGVLSGVSAKLGYEELAGNGTYSVETPLATLHAFNGWAEQFLTIPARGLDDTYLSVGGEMLALNIQAVYHNFAANKGNGTYGREWDLQLTKTIKKIYGLSATYASFTAGNLPGRVDTHKLWLTGKLSF